MASPVPFIQVDASNRLFVTEEAKAYLGEVNSTVGVVAVAGIYRTGKSFILNQLAGTTGSGFGVGNSVQAKTKGIWLWGAPLRLAPTPGAPQNLLLLDTEGGAQQDRFVEGAGTLAARVADSLGDRVVFSSPVRRIEWSARAVGVTGDDVRVRAERAIVAVPPVLAGRIRYDPPLPGYREISREGPDHGPVFTVEVQVQGFEARSGQGASKRAAEQRAAEEMMKKVKDV
jgi:hypothetical protein